MYGKHGKIEEARRIFDNIHGENKDVAAWSSIISAYARHGLTDEALRLFWRMVSRGVEPNAMIFKSVICCCASGEALEQGKAVHARLKESPSREDSAVQNALVGMYCKCGSLDDARAAFDVTKRRDRHTWTTLIMAYVQKRKPEKALELYHGMDVEPDEFILASVAAACSSLGSLEQGMA
ncbi:hypothetical protein SELMODRAFT_432564, partial [Selaginella moellendorffii]